LNPPLRALAVALVVGVGLAAGFISYRLESNRSLPASATPTHGAAIPSPSGTEPEASEASPPAPRPVPSTLPDVSLPDLAGTTRSLRSFGGRPLIVNFWATWCAPCRREIPLLRELRQRYQAERLEVVGIAIDFHPAIEQYLRQTPIDYPLLMGDKDGLTVAEQFGVQTVLPFSVFADATGSIVAVKVGELHREEADFILSEIAALDAGREPLADARARIEARLRELAVARAKAQQNDD
jgi:thiol-disulfide isomerase/thioredoxin